MKGTTLNCLSFWRKTSLKDDHLEELDIALNMDCSLETTGSEDWKFRVSDKNNGELFYLFASDSGVNSGNRKLILKDSTQQTELLKTIYSHGMGVLTLCETSGEIIGECTSSIEFECLSIKVKYLFTDDLGETIFKITTESHPTHSNANFKLFIQDRSNQMIGEIKMGRLKNCCHMKLNTDLMSKDEMKWILAIWISFMDYNLLNEENINDEIIQEAKIPINSKSVTNSLNAMQPVIN